MIDDSNRIYAREYNFRLATLYDVTDSRRLLTTGKFYVASSSQSLISNLDLLKLHSKSLPKFVLSFSNGAPCKFTGLPNFPRSQMVVSGAYLLVRQIFLGTSAVKSGEAPFGASR